MEQICGIMQKKVKYLIANMTHFPQEETEFDIHASEFHYITQWKELCCSDISQFSLNLFNKNFVMHQFSYLTIFLHNMTEIVPFFCIIICLTTNIIKILIKTISQIGTIKTLPIHCSINIY